MAVTFGFYDSQDHDRLYNATQFSSIFDGIINDGVYSTIGDHFLVRTLSGMNVTVGTGRAWFNHTWTLNDSMLTITIAAAESVLNRIDTIVIEVDSASRANAIKVITGTAASTATAPTLTNSGSLHQYPLCDIYVPAGATSISTSNITNRVGTSSCPFVTGILDQVSVDDLLTQWGAQWDEWFDRETTDATQSLSSFYNEKYSEYSSWFSSLRSLLNTELYEVEMTLNQDDIYGDVVSDGFRHYEVSIAEDFSGLVRGNLYRMEGTLTALRASDSVVVSTASISHEFTWPEGAVQIVEIPTSNSLYYETLITPTFFAFNYRLPSSSYLAYKFSADITIYNGSRIYDLENAVRNLADQVLELQDVDETPTADSEKLVQSGGVYSAIEDAANAAQYYMPGDTLVISENNIFAGYVVLNNTSIRLTIPLAKTISSSANAVYLGQGCIKIRGVQGYFNGSEAGAVIDLTNTSLYKTEYRCQGQYILVIVTANTAFSNSITNTPISVLVEKALTFTFYNNGE